jgi:hypothetical protein
MYFSKALYFQALKKIKTVGIGMAVNVIILNLMYALTEIDLTSSPHTYSLVGEKISGGSIAPLTIFVVLLAPFLVMQAFSFLNSRKGSDFYHSIPHKRECVYFSFVAAICTWIASIVAVTLLTNYFLFSISAVHKISFFDIPLLFLGYTASALVIVGVFTVCRMISGTGTTFFFYSICLLSIPRISISLFQEKLFELNPSISFENTIFASNIFSAEKSLYFVFLETGGNSIGEFSNILLLVFLLIESIILLAVGAYFYKNRKSELAGQSTPSKFIGCIFRCSVSIPMLIFAIESILGKMDATYTITFLTLALLWHFLFELILTKNLYKSVKSMPTILISALIATCFIGGAYLTAGIYRNANPTAEEIESFYFEDAHCFRKLDIENYYQNVPLSSDTALEIISKQLKTTSEDSIMGGYAKTKIKFILKDGREKYRIVNFRLSEEYIDYFANEIRRLQVS